MIEDGGCTCSPIRVPHVYVGLTTFGRQIRLPGLRRHFVLFCYRSSAYSSKFRSKIWFRRPRSDSTSVRPSGAEISKAVHSHVCLNISSRCRVMNFRPHSYIVHSSFFIIFPLHVVYLSHTTGRPIKDYMSGLSLAIKRHISGNPTEPEDAKFPWQRFVTMLVLMTVGFTLPAILWFCAVSLAP